MPTYDYGCECGHTWESFQSISAPVETKCPKCEQDKAKRLISSAPHFLLKGEGWASTGYSK